MSRNATAPPDRTEPSGATDVSAAPPVNGRLSRLAAWSLRHRRLVVLGWVVTLAAVVALSARVGGEFSADYSTPGSESKAAATTLAQSFPERSPDTVDVVWRADDVRAPAVRERTAELLAAASRVEGIGRAESPYAPGGTISRDGTTAVAHLQLDAGRAEEVPIASGQALIALADRAGGEGLQVALAGQAIDAAEDGELSSEAIGFLVAAGILLFTFGSVIAAGLPLVTALFGLGIGASGIGLLTALVDVPDWATSVAAMIGIGVGLDYALLIITRFRAALEAGAGPAAAVAESIATAGRSVLIAGSTVVVALLGLFLVGVSYLNGVALASSCRCSSSWPPRSRSCRRCWASPGAGSTACGCPAHDAARQPIRRPRPRRGGAARSSGTPGGRSLGPPSRWRC